MTSPLPCGLLMMLTCFATPGDDDPVEVPATILAHGVPPIARSVQNTLSRYQNIRTASFADWVAQPPIIGVHGPNDGPRSPMLVLTRFADTTQVHQVVFPGGARTQVTFHPERVLEARARPGHSGFIFTTDEGGGENYQVLLYEPERGESRRLTDGKSRHEAAIWSPSGKSLAYSANTRNGRDMDLYLLEPDRPQPARLLKAVDGRWTVADWAPDESQLVARESVSINEAYLWLIDVRTGETRPLTPERGKSNPAGYGPVRWAADGKTIYWTTDRDADFLRLVRHDLQTQSDTVLTSDLGWDVEDFDLSDDGRWIALITNEAGISRLRVLDAASGRESPAPELPVGVVAGLRFRPGSHELGFTLASARSQPDAYSVDLDTKAVLRWTISETAGFDAGRFAQPELIRFPSFDDREITAFVYRPDSARFPGKRPCVINIHGGPESQFRPGFLGRANFLIDALGITLIYPNVRGSSGYGRTFLALDDGYKREDSVKDIGALLDWITRQPDLDASRVGVEGGSYGGYMSLAVMTMFPERVRAGIDTVGISNFVTFLTNTSDYRRDLRRVEYGDERIPEMRDFLESISPLNRADRIQCPILVVQGLNDPRVPASEAEQIVASVRRNGIPVWYVVGINEGHGFAKKPNQDYLQGVQVTFWKRFLTETTP